MTKRVEELFNTLVDLPAEDRARYFEQHEIDDETRREVEGLLAFSNCDSVNIVRDIGASASQTLSWLDPGERRCGHFRLINILGRGGMGVVYLAERADGEVTQRAAIKLLQPGMGEGWHERFLQERQILAGLSHPNIARLLDAGRSEAGQPYLAMEYVDGRPIDKHCDGLGLTGKIRLFLRVCAAVAYLHRNLVVHRDIKPSNILVTAEGEPKLLDFGIAKILDLNTSTTITGMRMLTPDFASPEQVTGERVGTATDIYSLGAVLYYLLAGRSPHEFGEDVSPGAVAAVLSKRDITRPSAWNADLKGDLEAICLKALRKDQQDRYSSVDQMAADLENYLQGRPVLARPDTVLYRTRKFLRRNRGLVAAAAVAVAVLMVATGIAVRQAIDARYRFDQVRRIAHTLLFEFPEELDRVPGNTRSKALLISTAREYLDNLARSAGNDRGLLLEMSEAYQRLAGVEQGSGASLGQRTEAVEHYKRAVAILQRVPRRNREEDRRLIGSLRDLADIQRNLGQLREAEGSARQAVAIADGIVLPNETNAALLSDAGHARIILGRVLNEVGKLEQAAAELETGERLVRTGLGGKISRLLLSAAQERADLLLSVGRIPEAIGVLQQAERDGNQLIADAPPGASFTAAYRNRQVTWAMLAEAYYFGRLTLSLDQPKQALVYREKLCKGWEYLLSLDANNNSALRDLAVCRSETAVTLSRLNPDAAVAMARDGLNILEKLERASPKDDGMAFISARGAARLGMVLLDDSRPAEARRALEPAVDKHRKLLSRHQGNMRYLASLVWCLRTLGESQQALHRSDQARASFDEAVRLAEPMTRSSDLQHVWKAGQAIQAQAGALTGNDRCAAFERLVQIWTRAGGKNPVPLVQAQIDAARRLASDCTSSAR